MHRRLIVLVIWLGALTASSAGCSGDPAPADHTDATAATDTFERTPPPEAFGVHGYARRCVAVEAFDGVATVRYLAPTSAGDGFAFAAVKREDAQPMRLQASDLATYLLYDPDRRYFVADHGETSEAGAAGSDWQFLRPSDLESKLDRLDIAFKSPAEWRLQVSTRDPKRYQLQHYASDKYLTLTGLTDDPKQAAIVSLHPAEGCVDFPELGLDATGEPKAKTWPDGDLWGVAELHSHIFSDAGFGGGGLFHGAPFHRLGVERALPDCSRSHGPDGKRDIMGFFFDGDIGFDMTKLLPVIAKGEFATFNHKTDGYPTFSEWPNSRKRATHQTMYYRWLQRAWLAGLRLIVQHATGNSVMCELTVATGAQKTLYDCNDMVSVDHAIDRAYELERYIDAQSGGPGKGWLRIVKTSAEARAVIAKGKLAVVLGIEISNVFDCFLTPPKGFPACDATLVRTKLDHYRDRGVRVVFPVHKYDNGFSAGDGSSGVIEAGNFVNSGHYSNFVQDCPNISAAFDKGEVSLGGLNKPRAVYDSPAPNDLSGLGKDIIGTLAPFLPDMQKGPLKGDWCQNYGLTPLGKTLLHELMLRAMIIDVAHMPRRSLVQAYALLTAAKYPATKTHGGSNKGKIYQLGGMVGSRLGRCGDANVPGAMVKPLTSAVNEAKQQGAYPAEGLRFDLNGFAGGPGPRFGDDKVCGSTQSNPIVYPFTSMDGGVTFNQPYLGERKVDFNTEGMIHIGLLPEYIEDARRDGATDAQLAPLFRSAEAYVRMWERAEARAKALAK